MPPWGRRENADQRLNFAQIFNPLGTILGVFIGKELILSDHHLTPDQIRAMEPAAQAAWRASELAAVKLPYLGIACVVLLWALLVAIAKFPPLAQRVDAMPMLPRAVFAASPRFRATGWA